MTYQISLEHWIYKQYTVIIIIFTSIQIELNSMDGLE